MNLPELRQRFHTNIGSQIVHVDASGVPNFADKHSVSSRAISQGLLTHMGWTALQTMQPQGQTVGRLFENAVREFLQTAFEALLHLRPGHWVFDATGDISQFQQYRHLAMIEALLDANPQLKSALGADYLVKPDVVVARYPLEDDEINRLQTFIPLDSDAAALTPTRAANRPAMHLHAIVSVKWTIRSDRAQNTRTEALNLIRNRKGHCPHIVAVTAEPMPTRIAALALGTGDIDCVYHFALDELKCAIDEFGSGDAQEMLETLVAGDRLRDISDLPLDLVI